MALLNFDAKKYDTTLAKNQYALIPKGIYAAVICFSQIAVSKDRTPYLKLKFKIIDGDFKNRMIYNNFTINHHKQEARDKSNIMLAWLCQCIGVDQFSDTAQLHNKPLMICVNSRKDEFYGEQNIIENYQPYDVTSNEVF